MVVLWWQSKHETDQFAGIGQGWQGSHLSTPHSLRHQVRCFASQYPRRTIRACSASLLKVWAER